MLTPWPWTQGKYVIKQQNTPHNSCKKIHQPVTQSTQELPVLYHWVEQKLEERTHPHHVGKEEGLGDSANPQSCMPHHID